MAEYYFDIETYSPGERPRPDDEIITIQYQPLYSDSGKPKGDLMVLKAWESSEREVLVRFHSIFRPYDSWAFIPVGMSVTSFDFVLLCNGWKRAGIEVLLEQLIYNHPFVDIHPSLIMMNGGSFKGASLDRFTGKLPSGKEVAAWYAAKDYGHIEQYVRDEAREFVEFYQKLKVGMVQLRQGKLS